MIILQVQISKLIEGTVFVCRDPNASFDAGSAQVEMFSGKHPAGLVGTHIHHLDPVGEGKEVWHLSAQDVNSGLGMATILFRD